VFPTNPQAPSTLDSGLQPNTTYIYKVRAVDAFDESPSDFRGNDLATTMSFAAIQSNATPILFAHFDQIRTAINSARTANGDAALTWRQMLDNAGYVSIPVPAVGEVIRATHLLALRRAMDLALTAVGVSSSGYADDFTAPTLIKAVHITQLQG